jgi:hypothetical protein
LSGSPFESDCCSFPSGLKYAANLGLLKRKSPLKAGCA